MASVILRATVEPARIIYYAQWRCRHGRTSNEPCYPCGRSVIHKVTP